MWGTGAISSRPPRSCFFTHLVQNCAQFVAQKFYAGVPLSQYPSDKVGHFELLLRVVFEHSLRLSVSCRPMLFTRRQILRWQ